MRRRSSAWFWLVVAATLWAAVSRFYHLAFLPPQAWVDEVWYNLRARELLQTRTLHVFYPTFWGGMLPLMVDLAALVRAMGFNSPVASRAISAVSGVVSAPLAFACFDELLRREAWPAARRRLTAALVALLLPNLLYFLVASRIGYGPALIPPVTLFCVWQMTRARRTASWLNWVMAGLALGLAQYINLNGRFLVPLVGLLAVHDLVLARSTRRPSLVAGLVLLASAAALVATPLIVFFLREPQWFFARAQAVAVTSQPAALKSLLDNFRLIGGSFNFRGDPNPRHNLPGRPMFDWIQSLGFWVGIIWAIVRFRRSPTARELPVWAALMIVSSLITDEAPQFERMIGVAVPGAALTAIGWAELWQWTRRWTMPRRVKGGGIQPARLASGVAVLLVLVSLGSTAYDYFVRYPAAPGLAAALTATPVTLARQLIERAQAESVFVERLTEAEDVFAFDFLFPGTPVRRLDFRQCLPLVDRRPSRTTYLVLVERDPLTVEALLQAYGGAAVSYLQPEEAALMGKTALIEIPAGASAPSIPNPNHARFSPGVRLLGYAGPGPTTQAGESVSLTLFWEAEQDLATDLTGFLHVGRGEDDSPVVAQHDGQPCQGQYPTSLWRQGDVIPDRFAVTVPRETPAGDYSLAVGWYRYPSLERQPLVEADTPLPNNRAMIGTLTVLNP